MDDWMTHIGKISGEVWRAAQPVAILAEVPTELAGSAAPGWLEIEHQKSLELKERGCLG